LLSRVTVFSTTPHHSFRYPLPHPGLDQFGKFLSWQGMKLLNSHGWRLARYLDSYQCVGGLVAQDHAIFTIPQRFVDNAHIPMAKPTSMRINSVAALAHPV
jgi:hypothetical protein